MVLIESWLYNGVCLVLLACCRRLEHHLNVCFHFVIFVCFVLFLFFFHFHANGWTCSVACQCHLTTFDINSNQNEVSTYGFETPRKSACRHLWRCCVEHHAFFRLVRVSPIQHHDAELFSLGSRFRYRYVNRNQFVKNSFRYNFCSLTDIQP